MSINAAGASPFQKLPFEMTGLISTFLEEREVAMFQSSSKGIQKQINDAYEASPELSELQKVSKEFFVKNKEIQNCKKMLLDLRRAVADFTVHQNSWLGWLVKSLEGRSGVLGVINRLFLRASSSFKAEAEYRQKARQNIQRLSDATRNYVANESSISKEMSEISFRKSNLQAKEIVMNLFGGEEAFKKIPVLDLGDSEGSTGYMEFIKSENLAYPIMRGVDKSGRIFFTIKVGNECQTFFQRYSNDWLDWSNTWSSLFNISGYLVEGGKVSNHNKISYNAMKKLIQKGEVTFQKPSLRYHGRPETVKFKLAPKFDKAIPVEQPAQAQLEVDDE